MNSELIELIVHDLKNPLAALLSNLGFVAHSVKGDEMTSDAVQDCLLSTEVLSRLIENLSAMGMLEEQSTTAEETSITAVVSSVEKRMIRHAEPSEIKLSFHCDQDVQYVQANGKLLELAIENLVATSMSYAPLDSIIRVRAYRQDLETAVVAVQDDGPPIIDSVRELVTDRDGQIQLKSIQGGRYSRCLGFYVVGLIAKYSGGELKMRDIDGKSSIELHLPLLDS